MSRIAQTPSVRTVMLVSRWVPEIVQYEGYLSELVTELTDSGKVVVLNNDNPHALIADTAQGFCDESICSMVIDVQLLISDYGHLNVDGSTYIITRFKGTNSDFAAAIEGTTE